jgi:lysophospholipase L1-like esterase
LKAADPSREWQVVNCGGISYASYRLLPIMQELLAHKPDMFIVCTGQNEFLEERTYGDIKRQAFWVKQLHEQLAGWRIYGLTHTLLKSQSQTSKTANLTTEVEALLDYRGGLEKYHRDDSWRDGVIEHYEHSLRRMVHIARYAKVPIVLANPVSDLRDTPPFKTEVDSRLTSAAREEFVQLWERAKQADWVDLSAKTALVKQALAIDERHAEAHFLLAKIYEAVGDMEAAKIEYVRAKDEDICPLRMLESMHQALQRVADQTCTPLIDIRQLFEAQAKDGILGHDQLIDHVHPRIEGHQLIAMEFFRYMERQRMVTPAGDWIARQTQLYQANWDSLPANYYLQGNAHLEGLRRWAQGRMQRLRLNAEENDSD